LPGTYLFHTTLSTAKECASADRYPAISPPGCRGGGAGAAGATGAAGAADAPGAPGAAGAPGPCTGAVCCGAGRVPSISELPLREAVYERLNEVSMKMMATAVVILPRKVPGPLLPRWSDWILRTPRHVGALARLQEDDEDQKDTDDHVYYGDKNLHF